MSIDWTVPLQTRSGLPARVLHEYYNGVSQMWVVSLGRSPSTPGGKVPEIIKLYDHWGRDCTHTERGPGSTASNYDLVKVPPPDDTVFVVLYPATDELVGSFHDTYQNLLLASRPVAGQIKVVIDGHTGKVKSSTIL